MEATVVKCNPRTNNYSKLIIKTLKKRCSSVVYGEFKHKIFTHLFKKRFTGIPGKFTSGLSNQIILGTI